MIGAWDGIDEFVAVAEAGSFTAGARVFGSSVTHMSRSIARLEARLQAQLLHRTTRTVRLTDTGRLFLDHCRRMVLDRDEALGMVSTRAEPQGELRCTCSTTLGERFLTPILLRYGALYPQVQLHVELTNRIVDPVAEGYDLALRTGAFDDGRLLRVPIAERTIHSCASPAYLDRAGRPGAISDLKAHVLTNTITNSELSRPLRIAAFALETISFVREDRLDDGWQSLVALADLHESEMTDLSEALYIDSSIVLSDKSSDRKSVV